jgi:hypothetical protein
MLFFILFFLKVNLKKNFILLDLKLFLNIFSQKINIKKYIFFLLKIKFSKKKKNQKYFSIETIWLQSLYTSKAP